MKKILSTLLLVGLCACAQLGNAPPQSLDEGLAYAEGQVTALELSAVQAPQLKKTVLQKVLAIGDQATASITAARAAEGSGDTSTAQGKLALATSLVAQLAALLAANGVK